jgi:excisionase family DNA binding protein
MAQETKKMVRSSHSNSVMTVREVAHFLNIHVNTVRRWSDLGVLKAYRIGPRGDRRFRREDILAFLPLEDRGNSMQRE